MANKTSKKPSKVAKKAAAKRAAAKPVLLSGGNPQIAKGYGDAPVQAYIAAMPGWKSDVGRCLDAIIERTVPGVRKAVKWNSPLYGAVDEDRGWFLSFHCFAKYVKVTFFRGADLSPPPSGKSKYEHVRYHDIHEGELDEEQFADWVKQASELPGERMQLLQSLPLNERLDRIGQHIVRARIFFDLWFYFEGDSRPKIINTMREYNEFFRFTPHAYLAAYVIYMSGVFDKKKGTISLKHLCREAKKEGRLNAQGAAVAEALLAQAKPIADKIAFLRHNAFAHRTALTTYNDVFAEADVTPNELRDVTEMALEVANCLLLASGLKEQHFAKLPLQAAEAMMKTLAREAD